MDEPDAAWYCVDCGVRLRPDHEFCWNCGTRRWREPDAVPAPPAARGREAAAAAPPGLGGVKFFLAFWGVLLLVWAAYSLARELYYADTSPREAVVVTAVLIGASVVLACLHALAYHGIAGRHPGGWVIAVVVAGLWSMVLVGLPALYVLLQRSTREAFGLA